MRNGVACYLYIPSVEEIIDTPSGTIENHKVAGVYSLPHLLSRRILVGVVIGHLHRIKEHPRLKYFPDIDWLLAPKPMVRKKKMLS